MRRDFDAVIISIHPEPHPSLNEGDRVVIVGGAASDSPDYRDETGTVLQVLLSGYVEVELDHHGHPAVFAPERVEVTP